MLWPKSEQIESLPGRPTPDLRCGVYYQAQFCDLINFGKSGAKVSALDTTLRAKAELFQRDERGCSFDLTEKG